MKLLSLEPESSASANSATSAYSICVLYFYTGRTPEAVLTVQINLTFSILHKFDRSGKKCTKLSIANISYHKFCDLSIDFSKLLGVFLIFFQDAWCDDEKVGFIFTA